MNQADGLRAALRATAPPKPIPPAAEVFPTEGLRAAATLAERGAAADLRALAARGVDLNEEAPAGVTLLMYEIAAKNDVAASALLDAGADPNRLTKSGASPMLVAAATEDPRFLELLLDKGGDPNLKNTRGEPLLHQAINHAVWGNVRLLATRGADIEAKDASGRTPALKLAYINQYEEVSWLLDRGADPLAADAAKKTLRDLVLTSILDPSSPHEAWRKRVAERLGIESAGGAAAGG
jgi:ankyrin repeat protein